MKRSVRKHQSQPIIGIDLGTTNSCVSIFGVDGPEVICNSQGARTTPSVLSWDGDEELVGAAAWRRKVVEPTTTLYSIKRLIGRRFDDPIVKEYGRRVPFALAKDERGNVSIKVPAGKGRCEYSWSPVEISAKIIRAMKEAAETHLGEAVSKAVITVPAYFDDAQRKATQDAGKIAGLDVKRIINEPTAAALAYGLHRDATGTIAVFDLGGGTFDVSLLRIQDGVFAVLATAGDTYLGGDDVDSRLNEHLVSTFLGNQGIDLRSNPMALARLREAAEGAKMRLSSETKTDINIPYIGINKEGPVHFSMSLSRRQLETIVGDIIERTRKPCLQVMDDAGLNPTNIDHLILVGGMTRMPLVREVAEAVFGRTARYNINPEEVVAVGAAAQGAILTGALDDVVLMDVTPLTLGTDTIGDIFSRIILRNSVIPTMATECYTTVTDNQTKVKFDVHQGEREIASENRLLGSMVLEGIPPAPRGVAQVDVTFDIDENGVLDVTARERASGKSCNLRIENSALLSEEDLERMLANAERNAETDRRRRWLAEARNHADAVLYDAEKRLVAAKPAGARFLQTAVDRVRVALGQDDANAIERESERLADALASLPADA